MHTTAYRKSSNFVEKHRMEKTFSSKLSGIDLHYKIWMSDRVGNGILGDGKWQILKLIDEKGSLKAACDELGYTYRRTWGNLKKIESFFGFPLLDKHRGGNEGGKTYLTPEGKKLVKAFDRFHSSVDSVIQDGFEIFLKDLL
jgi:molybdate transport system regulatory protein